MRGRYAQDEGWDDRDGGYDAADEYPNGYAEGYDQPYPMYGEDEDGPGLVLQQDRSLVNVSATVTHHGAPLLSYAHTMNRFYTSRKQKLSAGRHKCSVCGERIRFWAWKTEDGQTVHDGCYERLAWTWTNLYAQQQRLAAEGRLE